MRKGPPVPPPKAPPPQARKVVAGDGATEIVEDVAILEDVEGEKAYEEEVVVRPGRFGPTIERARTAYGYIKRYERVLAAFSMVAGFITDNLMFRRIEFDLWYAANSSVMLDLQILVRTLFAVLRQDNAY